MVAKPYGTGAFLGSSPNDSRQFKTLIQQISFTFGQIVELGDQEMIVEALAAMQGMNTLAYALLQMAGFELDSLRQKAEALVREAVELNNRQ